MFSDKQMKSIKLFSSMTNITNNCFNKCINEFNSKELNPSEIKCLEICSDSHIKLRTFILSQLFEDYDSVLNKNKKIFEEKT